MPTTQEGSRALRAAGGGERVLEVLEKKEDLAQ